MADVKWTAEQARAITSPDDVLLVANAGTGKTTTVVGKILWLLGLDAGREEETGRPLPPCPAPCGLDEIAAITFTEKAAHDLQRKLRERIMQSERADELRWDIGRASVGTIHSFCGSLLREHALRLGIDPSFGVLDPGEVRLEMGEILRDVVLEALAEGDEAVGALYRSRKLHGYRRDGLVELAEQALRDLRWRADYYDAWSDGGELSVSRIREACGAWTEERDDEAVRRCDALYRLGHRALDRWQAFLARENVRDFDALILDARRLLIAPEGRPAVEELRSRYRILIVDEFQDTDHAQRDIVRAIGGGVPRPQLFLVGDPKQSIYRFRGADVSVWNEVEREMRDDGAVHPLTRNFRSAPAVIDFANRVGRAALKSTGSSLAKRDPDARIEYSDLRPGRQDADDGLAEWIAVTGDSAEDRRRNEARAIVGWLQTHVGSLEIEDPGSGARRPLQHRDVALLYRSTTGIEHYETVLQAHGIPFHHSQPPKLGERQEVADLVNALRLVENPRDDLRAFGYLRSPFVGLRDEVLARIRLEESSGSLLAQARRFLDGGAWFPAPEHADLVPIEREALRRGLGALDEARQLSSRVPLDELGRLLLERTGYLAHLVVLDRHRESVAHIHSFLRQLEDHRDMLLGRFLDMWDRREERDEGLPSAALHSQDDDVVTLSTMHRAKGLEWPVVFLIDVKDWKVRASLSTGTPHFDRGLGPVLMPKQAERGERAERLHERWELHEAAEEARVLYVAVTRARDRLIVVSEPDASAQLSEHLVQGRTDAVKVSTPTTPREPERRTEPTLDWLGHEREVEEPRRVAPLERPALRATTSATELMMRADDREHWERRYEHGVQPEWEFAPQGTDDPAALPARVRGTLIHGVLERIEEASELARILDETVGELDHPELEAHLSPGSRYREALEEEIRRVVEGEEWAWYVDGEHHRELPFVDLTTRPWRLGSFDLLRPRPDESWIIDFKTHEVEAGEAENVARKYEIQARVYLSAARRLAPVRMRLHFTAPDATVEMGEVSGWPDAVVRP